VSESEVSGLKVVNLVVTAELGQTVDLPRLGKIRGFRYDPATYRCAYLKDQHTKATVSIFSTGKMISAGTKSYDDARHDLEYARAKVSKLGIACPRDLNLRVRNIVAVSKLRHSIPIESLALKLPNVIYEPEQFPGAIYYAKELGGASILIFANGKLVLAGLKNEKAIETARRVLVQLARLISEEPDRSHLGL
jgi:transcription initiation factor TFIID TATA-box-binding protein